MQRCEIPRETLCPNLIIYYYGNCSLILHVNYLHIIISFYLVIQCSVLKSVCVWGVSWNLTARSHDAPMKLRHADCNLRLASTQFQKTI